MAKFLSDDEMAKIEGQESSRPRFISDDDMGKLEAPEEKPWYDVSAEGVARGALDALPVLSAAGGGILGAPLGPAGSVGGAGLGYAGGKELADILKHQFLGGEAPSVDPIDQVKRVGGNVVSGAVQEMGGQAIGAGLSAAGRGLSKGAQYLGDKMGSTAEKLYVNATGATGTQASKFADDAGRQLADRKLVRFGDTPEKIAARVGQAKDAAAGNIDDALKGLDSQGVTASADNVVAKLNQKIDELKLDPSQAGLVRKLKGIVEDIVGTGRNQVPVSAAEQTKRGFNKAAGNWMDPEAGQAGKQAYLAYMDEVERAAGSDPALSKLFTEGKETYGLLAPIEEAASRRAMTQNQSPWGGLGDMAAAGTGMLGGGPIGAAASVAAKKTVAPRLTSSAAVTLDSVSQMLKRSPKMAELEIKNPQVFGAIAKKMEEQLTKSSGLNAAENESKPYDKTALLQKTQGTKYGQVLQNAAQKGDQALGAAHFVLQSRDPEYRRAVMDNEDDEN